jgi:hypothetical protein
VKKVYQPVAMTSVDLRRGVVRVRNRYFHSDLSGLNIMWRLTADDAVVEEGALPPLSTPAGASEDITVPFTLPAPAAGVEYRLDLSFRLAADQPWAGAGREVAWEQFDLPDNVAAEPLRLDGMPALMLTQTPGEAVIEGPDFRLTFDRRSGTITSLRQTGVELIADGPRLNIWRAPTENDLNTWGDERAAIHWREVGYDQMEEVVDDTWIAQPWPEKVEVGVRSVLQVREGAERLPPEDIHARYGMLAQGLQYLLDDARLDSLCGKLDLAVAGLPGESSASRIGSLLQRITEANRVYDLLVAVREVLVEAGLPVPDVVDHAIAAGPADWQPKEPPPPARLECDVVYSIYGSGDVLVDVHIVPDAGLPFLPRLGLQLRMPQGFEQFEWYGRGPHETYSDRKAGARVGVFRGTVDEQYVPYIFPEENGNKEEVRWVSLTGADGVGLFAAVRRDADPPYGSVSAHHFTTEDLTAARHTHELTPRPEITLNLDAAQSGLGAASCGPGRLEKYQLKAEETRFRVRLRGFTAPVAPAELHARRPE